MGISARDTTSRTPRGAGASRTRHRRPLLGGAVAVTTLAMVAVTAPAALADSAPAPAPQRVGAAPHLPRGAVRTAAPAGDTPIDLGVVLSPRDPAGLKKFIADVSTPGSPLYHHYLGTGEFGPAFGASAAEVDRVRTALKAQGLSTGPLEADGLTLPVHTTVGAAGKAFRTGFTGYRTSDGRHGVANTTAPAVQGDVAHAIRGVTGLTTLAEVRPHFTVHSKPRSLRADTAGASGGTVAPRATSKTPALCSGVKTLMSSYPPQTDTKDYWSARTLATAYGMADQPNVGTGVSVGVFELEDYSTKDIAAYQSCYGTKVSVGAVKVDGGPKVKPDYRTGFGSESALDIEDLIGLVPQASLLVYQGPDVVDAKGNPVATSKNVLDVYAKMVNDNRVQVISTSWGSCELDTDDTFMDAENLIFQQAAAQGQTVTAAAGDDGSTDCLADAWDDDGDGINDNPNTTALSVDDPAGQPYVLGVGGTTMPGAHGTSESTWNSEGGATGGGVSHHFALDSLHGYQAGVDGSGYNDACQAAPDTKCRQVPDVAALADPDTGYLIANGQASDGGQYWAVFGGTSGASPTWAALIAQADLDLSCAAGGPVGFVNPALYKLPATAFRDITEGENYLPETGAQPYGSYPAGAGYDLTTGRGTPHARSVIPALCKAVPQSAAGTFTSVKPTRLLDTRSKVGVSTTTPVKSKATLTLRIEGNKLASIPASGVTAVVLNTTAVSPTASGYLVAYPGGKTRPTSANVNWAKGRTVADLAVVPVGADGTVKLYNSSSGTVHVVADVFGYFSTAAGGATYHPAGPARVLDTRSKTGVSTKTPVKAKATVALKVAGVGGVPAKGAKAVVLNVTVTGPTASGHLTAYPGGTTRPSSSNLNWVKGQTVPNLVVVPVGSNGKVNLYNGSSGKAHFVADVFGYYSTGTGASFHAAGPHRVLDTRSGIGASKTAVLKSSGTLALNLNDGNVLAHAKAVVLNVTVTHSTAAGYLTVWPDSKKQPSSSNLNWAKGQTVANLVTVPVVNGKVDFHVSKGSVDVIADLFGYYA